MGGGQVYVKKDCDLYKCSPNEKPKDDGDLDYKCQQQVCGEDLAKVDQSVAPSSDECRFVDSSQTGDRGIKLTQSPDGTVVVKDGVMGELKTYPAVATYKPTGDGKFVDITGGNVIERGLADLKFFLGRLTQSVCNVMSGLPASSPIEEKMPGAVKGLNNSVVAVGKSAVPVFTVDAAKVKKDKSVLPGLASWVEGKAKETDTVKESKLVAIYYPKSKEKEATALAMEYLKAGVHVNFMSVPDDVYDAKLDSTNGNLKSNKRTDLMKVRKNSITIAFIPTEGIKFEPPDTSPCTTDAEVMAQAQKNAERAESLMKQALGGSSGDEVYTSYLASLGLSMSDPAEGAGEVNGAEADQAEDI